MIVLTLACPLQGKKKKRIKNTLQTTRLLAMSRNLSKNHRFLDFLVTAKTIYSNNGIIWRVWTSLADVSKTEQLQTTVINCYNKH